MIKPEDLHANDQNTTILSLMANSSVTWARMVTSNSNTSLYISVAYRMSADGADNSMAIPIKVIGYN